MKSLENLFDEEGDGKKGLILVLIIFIGVFLFNFVGASSKGSGITVDPTVVSENGKDWLEVTVSGPPRNYEIMINEVENRIYRGRLWAEMLHEDEMKENKGTVMFKLGEKMDGEREYSLEVESVQRGNPMNWFFSNPPIYETKIRIPYELNPDR